MKKMKNRYKLIRNIGYKQEDTIYFDRLTLKKTKELKDLYSYVLLSYSDILKCYLAFDFRVNEYQKALYESNIREYCERY
jgi:hypothetical protein